MFTCLWEYYRSYLYSRPTVLKISKDGKYFFVYLILCNTEKEGHVRIVSFVVPFDIELAMLWNLFREQHRFIILLAIVSICCYLCLTANYG